MKNLAKYFVVLCAICALSLFCVNSVNAEGGEDENFSFEVSVVTLPVVEASAEETTVEEAPVVEVASTVESVAVAEVVSTSDTSTTSDDDSFKKFLEEQGIKEENLGGYSKVHTFEPTKDETVEPEPEKPQPQNPENTPESSDEPEDVKTTVNRGRFIPPLTAIDAPVEVDGTPLPSIIVVLFIMAIFAFVVRHRAVYR